MIFPFPGWGDFLGCMLIFQGVFLIFEILFPIFLPLAKKKRAFRLHPWQQRNPRLNRTVGPRYLWKISTNKKRPRQRVFSFNAAHQKWWGGDWNQSHKRWFIVYTGVRVNIFSNIHLFFQPVWKGCILIYIIFFVVSIICEKTSSFASSQFFTIDVVAVACRSCESRTWQLESSVDENPIICCGLFHLGVGVGARFQG